MNLPKSRTDAHRFETLTSEWMNDAQSSVRVRGGMRNKTAQDSCHSLAILLPSSCHQGSK